MQQQKIRPLWRKSMERIPSAVRAIRFPAAADLAQDSEWCEVLIGDERRRVRFHDYHEVYRVPGFYERLFYEKLRCNSPFRVARLFRSILRENRQSPRDLRILDVGAGNGMVAEELRRIGARKLVGVDIIPEAKTAAERDRAGLYADYAVADLTDLPEPLEERLRKHNLNALTCVAALGFGDIPDKAFLKALDLIDTPGWLAFNIKEDFIEERNPAGFAKLIRDLCASGVIQVQAYRRYRHRLSTAGKPLHYVAMVARKLKDVPDELMNGS